MKIRKFWQMGSASFTIVLLLVFSASIIQAQTWTASITAQSSHPTLPTPKAVHFGVNPASTDKDDPELDVTTNIIPAAPDLPYLNVAFNGHPPKGSYGQSVLSTDIRPAAPWALIVKSSDEFMLSWDLSSVPGDVDLSIDAGDGELINMRDTPSKQFDAGSYNMDIVTAIPKITLVSPASGSKGTQITVEGMDFGANEGVIIDFGTATAITEAVADPEGVFSATFAIPVQPNGPVVIKATGAASSQAAENSDFSYSGPQPIESVEVVGSPATPGDTITVTVVGEPEAKKVTFSIAETGAIDVLMNEDENTPGNYTGTYIAKEDDEVSNATVTAVLEDIAGNITQPAEAPQKVTITTVIEFDLALNAGFNLIAIPVFTESIKNVKDLAGEIGEACSLIISLDAETGKFQSFIPGTTLETAKSNVNITGTTGLIVSMKQAKTLNLAGDPWPEGDISLNAGFNMIGIPLKNENLKKVIDLSTLLSGNVNLIISLDTETGKFQSFIPGTTLETAKSNIVINGGVGLILSMKSPDEIPITGEPWSNESKYMAPSREYKLTHNQTISPILELDGATTNNGLSVTARNLSSGAVMTDTASDGHFSVTFVDFSANGAAKVGDIFEISFNDANGKVRVDSIRYTVTERDIQLGRIALGDLVAYAMPKRTELLQNWPNPFNPETWIPFELKEASDTSITIYDVHGQVVRRLNLGYIPAGAYQTKSKAVYWNGINDMGERVASGVYFYHLQAGEFSASRKMVILK
jgi:hypothetical protein